MVAFCQLCIVKETDDDDKSKHRRKKVKPEINEFIKTMWKLQQIQAFTWTGSCLTSVNSEQSLMSLTGRISIYFITHESSSITAEQLCLVIQLKAISAYFYKYSHVQYSNCSKNSQKNFALPY